MIAYQHKGEMMAEKKKKEKVVEEFDYPQKSKKYKK